MDEKKCCYILPNNTSCPNMACVRTGGNSYCADHFFDMSNRKRSKLDDALQRVNRRRDFDENYFSYGRKKYFG